MRASLLMLGVLLGAGALAASARARADVLPPNMDGCAGKATGSKCLTDDGKSGECTEIEWSSPRYGRRAPDGSSWIKKMVVCTAPLPPTNSGMAQEGASSESDAGADLPRDALVGLGAAGVAAAGTVIAFAVRRRRSRAPRA